MSGAGSSRRLVVGVTGASGACYARRLIDLLVEAEREVHLVVTPHGERLLADESGIAEVDGRALLGREESRLIVQPYGDVGAVIASGSLSTEGMIVCPCSGNTLAQIAAGMSDNLLTRAAQVTLKEGRRLVVVPREMPVSQLELENCLRLSRAGAIICPASPGFYMRPERVEDLIDFVVGRLLDLVGVAHQLDTRWSGGEAPVGSGGASSKGRHV